MVSKHIPKELCGKDSPINWGYPDTGQVGYKKKATAKPKPDEPKEERDEAYNRQGEAL